MVWLDFLLNYGVSILSIIVTIIILIVSSIKAHKTGNTKGVLEMYAKIPSLVTTAEQLFGKGNGVAKLNYVLTELRVYALEHGIKVDSNEIEMQVNSVVDTTKLVNLNAPSKADAESASNADATNTTSNTQNTIIV